MAQFKSTYQVKTETSNCQMTD